MMLKSSLSILILLAVLSGCAMDTKNETQSNQQNPIQYNNDSVTPQMQSIEPQRIAYRQINHTPYASLEELSKATGYNGEWLSNDTYGIGDHDPEWTFTANQSRVQHSEHSIQLPSAAVKRDGQLYIPATGLKKVFHDVALFVLESDHIAFYPVGASPRNTQRNFNSNFNSFADSKKSTLSIASTQDNFDKLISYAKSYLGVQYDFGAEPYRQSQKFDCSSFTQHVYDVIGIDLPRLARTQATLGEEIERDQLQPGDLLFFYVPNRFKTNDIVGHVGIYMGEGKMVHSSPKPEDGVQITPINKPYWEDTFLFAKRVK